ncbi:hypothetical protein GGR54DRAFT_606148 [Hypoxylon sp. NC1633]|nr:hypothetical protein GGR54DRAFT_606148 [Hypoxylon sp. NC1633]
MRLVVLLVSAYAVSVSAVTYCVSSPHRRSTYLLPVYILSLISSGHRNSAVTRVAAVPALPAVPAAAVPTASPGAERHTYLPTQLGNTTPI